MNRSSLRDRMPRLVPGIAAGTSLGISDVLAKVVLAGGGDVVSMLSFRSLVGLAFVATWFRFGRPAAAMRTQYGRGRDGGPIKITGGHLPGSVVW